jgi:hypothetical protein
LPAVGHVRARHAHGKEAGRRSGPARSCRSDPEEKYHICALRLSLLNGCDLEHVREVVRGLGVQVDLALEGRGDVATVVRLQHDAPARVGVEGRHVEDDRVWGRERERKRKRRKKKSMSEAAMEVSSGLSRMAESDRASSCADAARATATAAAFVVLAAARAAAVTVTAGPTDAVS